MKKTPLEHALRIAFPSGLGGAVFLLLYVAACNQTPPLPAQETQARRNVVLIVTDTLRSDHLSVEGYPKPTSPYLERLARRGVYFNRHYSHSAVTRCSVASLFTSKYPSGHGVVNQGPAALPPELPSLPAVLAAHGYETYAFVTNPQIHPSLGFGRGFSHFRGFFGANPDPTKLVPHDVVKTPAAVVFGEIETKFSSRSPQPFFLYVHLLDPHGPYNPPRDLRERFTDASYQGSIGSVPGGWEDFGHILRKGEREGPDLEQFVGLYDAEIASVDRAISEFLEWMENEGLLEETYVIITSDHGEGFMEHGFIGHGTELNEEVIGIPLLWLGPDVPEAIRIAEPTATVDVFPTLIDLLDLDVSSKGIRGESLRSRWEDPASPQIHSIFLEGPGTGQTFENGRNIPDVNRGLIRGSRKILATNCALEGTECKRVELVDIDAQGKESTLRSANSPEDRALVEEFETLQAAAAQRAAAAVRKEGTVPPRVRESLRSLGYTD